MGIDKQIRDFEKRIHYLEAEKTSQNVKISSLDAKMKTMNEKIKTLEEKNKKKSKYGLTQRYVTNYAKTCKRILGLFKKTSYMDMNETYSETSTKLM